MSVNYSVYCFVSSNKPILLVQFAVGSSIDSKVRGDPFMVIIPPIEQYKSSYSLWIFRHTNNFLESFYVNLLVPEGTEISGIMMNGQMLDSKIKFTPILGNQRHGWAAQLEISNGFYNFTHSNSSNFNVIAYWASFRSGSGYFGGMNQIPIACKLSLLTFTVQFMCITKYNVTVPHLSLENSTYEVFENERTINISVNIRGTSFEPCVVRVSAMPYSTDSPALSKFQ